MQPPQMDRENTPKFIRKSPHLLPHHIIEEEILPRLPVKSLYRFRCVSKSWASLIESKRFIKTHLQNSSRNTDFPYQRLILNLDKGIRIKQCSLQSMLDGSIATPIDDPNINQLKILKFVGCVNGLVCILYNYQSFVFWNPSTRNFKKLPQTHEVSSDWHILNRGFGWDESSDDYKVFALVYIGSAEELIGKVYSSKTNSWKTIEHMYYLEKELNSFKLAELMDSSLIDKEGMFVGGKLHWNRYEEERNIACFDLKTEIWGKIKLPYTHKYNAGSNYRSMVGVIGGCLSSVKLYSDELYSKSIWKKVRLEVWVMKEYGWSKLVALSHFQELVQRPLSATYAVGRHGEVLLFFGMIFLVYYPQHNEFRSLQQFDDIVYQQNICVESLVWPQVA